MKDADRLPWFPCYPGKLLGALAGMTPDQGYVYTIILLRIYEVSGPCTDTTEVIARRCGMRPTRAARALEWLLDKRKLVLVGGGYMNETAEDVLTTRRRKKSEARENGKRGAEKSFEKVQTKQRNGAAHPLAVSTDKDLDIDSDTPPLSGGRVSALRKRITGTTLPDDWNVDEGLIEYGIGLGLSRGQIMQSAEAMKEWARGNANRAIARKADWRATFQGWMRRDAERFKARAPMTGRPSMYDLARGGGNDEDE